MQGSNEVGSQNGVGINALENGNPHILNVTVAGGVIWIVLEINSVTFQIKLWYKVAYVKAGLGLRCQV